MSSPRAALVPVPFLLAFACAVCSAPEAARVTIEDPAAPEGLRGLAWLSGSWESVAANGTVTEERWTPARGGTIFGVSRTLRGGRTVFFEFLRIEERNGEVVYLAAPRGGEAVPFRLVHQAPGHAVFENLEHDDPQRILYWREAGGGLRARIETDTPGRERAAEWRYQRAAGTFAGSR